MLIDISRTLGWDDVVYPGDPPTQLEKLSSLADGASFELTGLAITVHSGTHLDAPSHFVPGGQTIAALPLERFFLKAHVIDVGDARVIEVRDLERYAGEAGEAVLLKTANALLPREEYQTEHVQLSVAAAKFLVGKGVALVGIDYISIEASEDGEYPVHQELLGSGVLILEDIDLRGVEAGSYMLMCFPLLIADAEASPCRAVLLSDD